MKRGKYRRIWSLSIFQRYRAEYAAYRNAGYRCTCPQSENYSRYGGRGIKFLFTSFQQFIEHIGPRPSPELSLDRIDNDGNYELGNVRWATFQEQTANKCKKYTKTHVSREKTLEEKQAQMRARQIRKADFC